MVLRKIHSDNVMCPSILEKCNDSFNLKDASCIDSSEFEQSITVCLGNNRY